MLKHTNKGWTGHMGKCERSKAAKLGCLEGTPAVASRPPPPTQGARPQLAVTRGEL